MLQARLLVVVGYGIRLVVAEAHDEDRGVQSRSDHSCRTDDEVETDASLHLTEGKGMFSLPTTRSAWAGVNK